jgi:hypothetical protein
MGELTGESMAREVNCNGTRGTPDLASMVGVARVD